VTLSAQGWPARKIARELGLNRETVGRYLRLAADAAKPAILPIRSKPGRTSQCVPLCEIIQKGARGWAFLPGDLSGSGDRTPVHRLLGGTSLMVKNCTLSHFWLRFSQENA
jgi:hypothetical protein